MYNRDQMMRNKERLEKERQEKERSVMENMEIVEENRQLERKKAEAQH